MTLCLDTLCNGLGWVLPVWVPPVWVPRLGTPCLCTPSGNPCLATTSLGNHKPPSSLPPLAVKTTCHNFRLPSTTLYLERDLAS